MHPNATVVRRSGEVNAWDNEEFRAAVRATGKDQLIIAGITTDVCITFLALSLVEEGYTVFANSDASGTFNVKTADEANARMRNALVGGGGGADIIFLLYSHILSIYLSTSSDLRRFVCDLSSPSKPTIPSLRISS
ncbi:hydrolase [Coprinopsis cinerea okayama7|uniref:Hydrolase n=1 Tax=Coprinopsis cinerea (strain Okayama-7 / 130 / ATCC MYA-4618 / FGSC 9003) TaxID=240176 RepID=A8NJR6_COPC7|nr:hydrolase [Coprinopsis cinerea okayama7\|eukprot:XP_001834275.2 hydrolase [Coprinopsis cinerea okayama7\